jgi:hypothetical protein
LVTLAAGVLRSAVDAARFFEVGEEDEDAAVLSVGGFSAAGVGESAEASELASGVVWVSMVVASSGDMTIATSSARSGTGIGISLVGKKNKPDDEFGS